MTIEPTLPSLVEDFPQEPLAHIASFGSVPTETSHIDEIQSGQTPSSLWNSSSASRYVTLHSY